MGNYCKNLQFFFQIYLNFFNFRSSVIIMNQDLGMKQDLFVKTKILI